MITTVKQFLAENKRRAEKGLKSLNESFGEDEFEAQDDLGAQEDELDLDGDFDAQGAQEIEGEDEVQEEITFDSFKDAYMNNFNEFTANAEEGSEPIEMPSDEQLQIAFDTMMSLNTAAPAQEEDELGDVEGEDELEGEIEDAQTTEEEEVVEEGLKSFFKGGTPEELAAKKEAFDSRVAEIESKFAGKTLKFKEYADNKVVDFSKEVADAVAKKNNYLGELSTLSKGDITYVMYKPGKKGLNKLGAAAGPTTRVA